MKKYLTDGHAVASDPLVNKYKVSIELTVVADSPDDAWEISKAFLDSSIHHIEIEDEENDIMVSASEVIEDFDILDAEPAELDW